MQTDEPHGLFSRNNVFFLLLLLLFHKFAESEEEGYGWKHYEIKIKVTIVWKLGAI